MEFSKYFIGFKHAFVENLSSYLCRIKTDVYIRFAPASIRIQAHVYIELSRCLHKI